MDEMIKVEDSEKTFQVMLRKIGITDNSDVLPVWETFKVFAELPFECSENQFWFQCGVYNTINPGMFTFHFSRNFIMADEGIYYTNVLDCEFVFELNQELAQLHTGLLSDTLEEFIAKVEQLPEFQIPASQYSPIKFEMSMVA